MTHPVQVVDRLESCLVGKIFPTANNCQRIISFWNWIIVHFGTLFTVTFCYTYSHTFCRLWQVSQKELPDLKTAPSHCFLLLLLACPEDGPGIAQNEQHHSQIDYILVRKCFRSRVNSARARSFPGADVWGDHDLLMMTFHFRLKRISKPKHNTQVWPRKAERSQCVGNLPSYDKREVCTSHHHEQWRYRPGFDDHHLQHSSDWNSQWDPWQTSSKDKNPGSLHKFLICATKGENWERNDLNLKDLRNIRMRTTPSRGARKRQNKTG